MSAGVLCGDLNTGMRSLVSVTVSLKSCKLKAAGFVARGPQQPVFAYEISKTPDFEYRVLLLFIVMIDFTLDFWISAMISSDD